MNFIRKLIKFIGQMLIYRTTLIQLHVQSVIKISVIKRLKNNFLKAGGSQCSVKLWLYYSTLKLSAPSSNPGWSISLCANALGEGMNPLGLLSAMGKEDCVL